MSTIKTTLVSGVAWVDSTQQFKHDYVKPIRRIPVRNKRAKKVDTDKNFEAWFEKSERQKMEEWQKKQLEVATGVSTPTIHPTTYIAIIEELETENRMLRARNERLTMAMKKATRLLQEHS